MPDARQLNRIIDETKCSASTKPIQIILTRIKEPFFSADTKSAYNQIPLDKPSQGLTNFVIAFVIAYHLKRLFYGISIGQVAFSLFMSSIFLPLIRQNKIITYLDDVTIDTMSKKLINITKSYKLKISKPPQINIFFSYNQYKKFRSSKMK